MPKRYVKSDPKYNRDLLDGASSVIMTYDNEKRCWIDINGRVLSDEEMHLLLETANTEITRGIRHQN